MSLRMRAGVRDNSPLQKAADIPQRVFTIYCSKLDNWLLGVPTTCKVVLLDLQQGEVFEFDMHVFTPMELEGDVAFLLALGVG